MNKDTWQTISEEGKTVWDKLTNSDKQKILQYAMKRAEAKGGISVNQTMIQELDHNMNPEEAGEPGAEDNSAEEQTLEAEVNQAVSKARSEAHPGDVRRVMSGIPKKRAVTQVKFAQWSDPSPSDEEDNEHEITDLVDDYDWDPDDGYESEESDYQDF